MNIMSKNIDTLVCMLEDPYEIWDRIKNRKEFL